MGLLDSSVQEYMRRRDLTDPAKIAEGYLSIMNSLGRQDPRKPPVQPAAHVVPSNQQSLIVPGQVATQGTAGQGGLLAQSGTPAAGSAMPATPLPQSPPPEYTELQKWRREIDAMMLSGVPALQEQAIAMMNPYRTTATSSGSDNRSAAAKMADEMGLTGVAKTNFIRQYALKKNYADPSDTPYSVSDLKSIRVPDGKGRLKIPPPGYTPRQAVIDDAVLINEQSSTDAGRGAMLKTAKESIPVIKSTLYKPDGAIDRDALNIAYILAKDPTVASLGSKFIMESSGKYTPEQIEKGKQLQNALEYGLQAITRTETGAAMPEGEIDNTRRRFQPSIGDPDSVVEQKLKAYVYFIENALDLMDPAIASSNDVNEYSRELQNIADKALDKFKPDTNASGSTVTYDGKTYTRIQ